MMTIIIVVAVSFHAPLCQGENTKYVCGRSRISVLNIFP